MIRKSWNLKKKKRRVSGYLDWRDGKRVHQEATSLNPSDAMATCVQECKRERNWPCSLGGRGGVIFSPVNAGSHGHL